MYVTPPANEAQLPARLLASGVAQEQVDRFMAQFRENASAEAG
jgi:hypothetical protein